MIAELGLAIEAGVTAEDIALTIHAHPTLGEITMEAAEVAIGSPIHIVIIMFLKKLMRMHRLFF